MGTETETKTEPVLASQLLAMRLRGPNAGAQDIGQRISICGGIGGRDLDEFVLRGGIERGEVVGVSAEAREGVGRLISIHLLCTLLNTQATAKANIIDTTGSFSLPLLANVFRYRILQSRDSDTDASSHPMNAEMIESIVQNMMARVSISRVFDLEGVCEVVSEISGGLRDWERERDRNTEVEDKERQRKVERKIIDSREGEEKVTEIGDSQDEDENDDDNKDFSCQVRGAIQHGKSSNELGRVEMIIVDDITTPISGLFSQREKGAAHAILAAFSRILHSLSQQFDLLTILHNSTRTSFTLDSTTYPAIISTTRSSRSKPQRPASVFASTTARPALGRLFSNLVTLHLFVSSVPLTQRDAEVLYNSTLDHRLHLHQNRRHNRDGNDTSDFDPDPNPDQDANSGPDSDSVLDPQLLPASSATPDKSRVAFAYVLEVLKDEVSDLGAWILDPGDGNVRRRDEKSRNGKQEEGLEGVEEGNMEERKSREQRWGTFATAEGGIAIVDLEGVGVGREKGRARHGGHGEGGAGCGFPAPKRYPFGRRV